MEFVDGEIASIEGTWKEDDLISCELLIMRNGNTATNYDPKRGHLFSDGTVKV